ncbi:MAG: hydroxymethylbilane synthase [Armatimonadetes bacterium]|nr:hydroxymethylbilane synthase [Armatimonadota bacterium]
MTKLRLGTRGSRLAMAQAENLKGLLEAAGVEIEIVTVRTSGDKGDRFRLGAFVGELQTALLEKRIDLALHCLKDVPTIAVPGLCFIAHLKRGDPRDTVITRGEDWRHLPGGAIVGTGSLRRTSQIRRIVHGMEYRPLIGNVDTRLRKLSDGEYDAIVLAKAGLDRLEWTFGDSVLGFPGLKVQPLSAEELTPAPGQAVLVIEARVDDSTAWDAARFLNDPVTEVCATAERSFLAEFGTGCSMPIGALASKTEAGYEILGRIVSPDGASALDSVGKWKAGDPEQMGVTLADDLIARGARDLLPEEALL